MSSRHPLFNVCNINFVKNKKYKAFCDSSFSISDKPTQVMSLTYQTSAALSSSLLDVDLQGYISCY